MTRLKISNRYFISNKKLIKLHNTYVNNIFFFLVRPLNVEILEPNQSFVAGRKYELICQSSGSRPPARVTWWNEGRRLDKTKDTVTTFILINFIFKEEKPYFSKM